MLLDPLAVKKVKTQVYRGFSVGIKAPRAVRDNKALMVESLTAQSSKFL
jgi:hypothetical protein